MKITKLLFLFLLFPFFSHAQTADAVVEKFLTAIDAKDNDVSNITSFKYNRSYVANTNTDYDEEVVIVGDENQLSRKKTLLKRDFYYVLNGNEAWIKIPMGSLDKKPTYNVKALNAKEVNELSIEANDGLFAFIDYANKGYKLSSPVKSATVNGKSTTLIAIDKDGIEKEFYFDNTTGLLVREEWTENNITHTMDYTKYDKTPLGFKLPVAGTYINSKDKRKNNVTTKWVFEKPAQGVSFAK